MEFSLFDTFENVIIRKDDEPDWIINQKLHDAVIGDMPDNLSLEEQAMFIYCKLCRDLTYDEGYLYRHHLADGRYTHNFDKEHLENIKPGSKITCWDFSRIYSKLVNELEGDIEAVVIAKTEKHGHYLTGFYTDRVCVMLEAVNNRAGGLNDLTKSKNGIEFDGIKTILDRQDIIKTAVQKVYPLIFGKTQSSLEDYIKSLKDLSIEEVPDNLELRLQSFIETMKQNNISGNEAIQTFYAFRHSGFFGKQLDGIVYLGKPEIQNSKKTYKRVVLIKASSDHNLKATDSDLYLMDSDSLELSTCMPEELLFQLQTGELVFESNTHTTVIKDKGEK